MALQATEPLSEGGGKAGQQPPARPSSQEHSNSDDTFASGAKCSAQPSTAQDDAGCCSWITSEDRSRLRAMTPAAATNRPLSCALLHRLIKRLPPGSKPVKLVGEGAANAVFEIKVPRSHASKEDFKGMLLRVAKVPRRGQQSKYNYILQQQFYTTSIKPILDGYANHQELVILRDTDIISQVNTMLQDTDHTRNPKFRGSFVGLSDWGLLTRDMRPLEGSNQLLVEFKPKWLAQSPSAPSNAVRCRQCAVEFQRLLTKSPGKPARPENKPCPLALMDPDAPEPVGSPFRIAPQLKGLPDEAYYADVLREISRHPLLQTLREQQQRHDPEGPLNAQADDSAFGVAMTIRDCTCFVQIPRSRPLGKADQEPLTLRLADLDWKDADTKLHTWRNTERRLVDGGYYTAEWLVCNGEYYRPPTLCLLELASRKTAPPDIIYLQDEDGDSKDVHLYVLSVDTMAFQKVLAPLKKDGT